jgi:hypothetical protein
MDDNSQFDETMKKTDQELVLSHKPTAKIESRTNARTTKRECRVVCVPMADQRRDLGPWCGNEDRAWKAACLRLGLRLHRRD